MGQKVTLTKHPTRPSLWVTEDGRVFEELATSPSSGGYHTVHVQTNSGTRETVRRHTLIAETFVGPRPTTRHEVRHLNGNPSDDSPLNLAWGTRTENAADMIGHGRSTTGEKNARAKLTNAQALEIKTRREAGESGSALAAEFNISQQRVCDIWKGRTSIK